MQLVRLSILSVPVLCGCAGSLSRVERMDTPVRPNEAEEIMEKSFRAMGIPILETNPNGWVRSGLFDPSTVFGAGWASRVTCNFGLENEAKSGARPTQLEVNASIRSNRESGTRIEIDSYGRGVTDDGKEVRCNLSHDAVEILMAAVPRPGFRFGGG